jgi:hypothetical protein
MDYETRSRRRQRLEKKRLRLVKLSGEANPYCSTCKISDDRCLHIDRSTNKITCRNCSLKRVGISDEARRNREKFFAELGYPTPCCIVCRENDICVIEEQHFFGEGNSSLSGPMCANCHAIQSDMQNDFPVDLLRRDPERRSLLRQAAFLLGIFILLSVLGFRETRLGENPSLATALISVAGLALAWAYWNYTADSHFALKFGPDYDKSIPLNAPS